MKANPGFSHGRLMNMPDDASVRIEPGDHKAQSHQGIEPGTGRIEHMAKNGNSNATAELSLTAALAAGKRRPANQRASAAKADKPTVFEANGRFEVLDDGTIACYLPASIVNNQRGVPTYKRPGKNTPADRRRRFPTGKTDADGKPATAMYEVDDNGNRILTGFTLGTVQYRIPLPDGGQLFGQFPITRHLPEE